MRASMDRPWRKVEVKVEGISRPFRKNSTNSLLATSPTPPATAEDQCANPIDHGTLQMDIEENPGLVPISGISQARDNQDFEQQLRDIDVAINYPNQSPIIFATFPELLSEFHSAHQSQLPP